MRLIKDLDVAINGRDVLLVEDVVDTGLTLNYVCRTLSLRIRPRWPPSRSSTGRTGGSSTTCPSVRRVHGPDEFFVGYGFDLDERYRHLPDLHLAHGAS